MANDLSISKERATAVAAALETFAGKHAKGMEVEVDFDLDNKAGYMEFTITLTNAEQVAAIEKYKSLIARQIAKGTFGEEEGEEEDTPKKKPKKEVAKVAKTGKKPKAAEEPEEEEDEVTFVEEVIEALGELEDWDEKFNKHVEAALKAKQVEGPIRKALITCLGGDKELIADAEGAGINLLYLLLAMIEMEPESELTAMQTKRMEKAVEYATDDGEGDDGDDDGDDGEDDGEGDDAGEEEDDEVPVRKASRRK